MSTSTPRLQDVSLGRTTRLRAARLMLGLLAGAAPFTLGAHACMVVVASLAPAVTAVAAGDVVAGLAAGAPFADLVSPALVLGVALLVVELAGAFNGIAEFVVRERFTAELERRVMRAVSAIPGLALFEDSRLADRLEIARWTAGGELSSGGNAARVYLDFAYLVRYAVAMAGAALVVSRWGWWVPVLVVATAGPECVLAWRHAGTQAREEAAAATEYRRSHWFLDLAFDTGAAKETRVFALQDWVAQRHHGSWLRAFAGVLADLRRQMRDEGVVAVLSWLAIVAAIATAVARASRGVLGPGDLTAGLLALPLLFANAGALAQSPGQFRHRLAHLPDVAGLLELEIPPDGVAPPRPTSAPEIRFEGVRFAYPGTDRLVLDGVDLVVEAGTSLALVGENGSGKSTLVKLLCRFYDPDDGRILLDGEDLRAYDLTHLRSLIAVVFQDAVRYPFSLVENIAIGCLQQPDAVEEAARLAGATGLAARLPNGWDTVVAPDFGGVELSGGEWQRVALARALASRIGGGSAVLIADEPTAHMDVRIEHDLYTRFADVTAGQTTILVSHRFSTVRMADRIAVLENGRIVEHASHDELVAAGGRYAELYELQARRFRETGVLE